MDMYMDMSEAETSDDDDHAAVPRMSLWPMKDSDPFIPRFISFEGGKVVPVGRQAILDPDDTASTAFFTTQTVSEKHAELFFRQGAFYVR